MTVHTLHAEFRQLTRNSLPLTLWCFRGQWLLYRFEASIPLLIKSVHIMKTLHTIVNRWAGVGGGLFGIFLLTAPTLFAQTFTSRDYLAKSPVNFQAFVYPAQHKPVINIRIENRSAHAVRIQFKNEAQQTVYDDYVSKKEFAGRFNVSALPYGTYTVELSNRTTRHRQAFRIGSLRAERIVMVIQPTASDSLLAEH